MGGRAGTIAVLFFAGSATASELCFEADSLHGNVTMDCFQIPTVWPNAWTGYSSTGPPCHSDGWTALDACGNSEAPYPYAWTISASPTDPDQNTSLGEAPASLYLWFRCLRSTGAAAAAFDVQGDVAVAAFAPGSGWTNYGTATQLLLAHAPCVEQTPTLVGTFSIESTAVDSQGWGRLKAPYRVGK
jgi:hypothetical protein